MCIQDQGFSSFAVNTYMCIKCNLVPRFSLLPVERPWLGLVTCLPESGRLQTNDLGEGRISVRFVSTKRRHRDQWKLRIRPCLKGPVFYSSRTSQDKTSNAESFDSESVTSCRISGCLSNVAKEITDSPLVQSKIFYGFRRLYSYRNTLGLNSHFYVMEATFRKQTYVFSKL